MSFLHSSLRYVYSSFINSCHTSVQMVMVLMLIPNKSIKWQQLNVFRHKGIVKMSWWSSNPSIWMTKKGDLSDTECGVVVGARQACLSISETADVLGFLWTTISWGYIELPKEKKKKKKKKNAMNSRFVSKKCHVDARGQGRMLATRLDKRKATIIQITNHCKQGMKNSITGQWLPPLSAKNRKWGYNLNRLTKIVQ